MYKLKTTKINNGYEFKIYDETCYLHICTFYGSINAMWDSVPGARTAEELAKDCLEYLNTKVKE